MSKLFTMARQAGRNMMARVAAMLAMGSTAWPPSVTLSALSQHWPMPNHRNSTAAADKRCARRRLISAVRGGAATSPSVRGEHAKDSVDAVRAGCYRMSSRTR